MTDRVLVVEDDDEIRDLIRYNLVAGGLEVEEADDGAQALDMLRRKLPDLAVVDWMLPTVSGVDICRAVRREPATSKLPILILTARKTEKDMLQGFSGGADDYLVKPFSTAELLARVRALLRRSRQASDDRETPYFYHDLELSPVTHRVSRSGRRVHLGPTEFRLLRKLIEAPERVFTRQQLLDSVWGENIYVEERTVDVHIRRLRKALNEGGGPDLIRTVWATGYALDADST